MKFQCGRNWDASRSWHSWFAWHPVRVADNECRWLETVERRNTAKHCRAYYNYEYRNVSSQFKDAP